MSFESKLGKDKVWMGPEVIRALKRGFDQNPEEISKLKEIFGEETMSRYGGILDNTNYLDVHEDWSEEFNTIISQIAKIEIKRIEALSADEKSKALEEEARVLKDLVARLEPAFN